MQILSVALTNFKVHSDRVFEFQPGINAICGENGAGKTSILEAIAWVLFDHCDYRREELIRRGCASAQATVTFVSRKDQRTYQVERCTSRNYTLYDPQLRVKLDLRRNDEVNRWLKENLGFGRETKLNNLFKQAIGIPQGTFTLDFLLTPEKRKEVFDPILQVREYKQAYEKSAQLERHASLWVQSSEEKLKDCETKLQDWELLKTSVEEFRRSITADEAELLRLAQQCHDLKTQRNQLKSHKEQIDQQSNQLKEIENQITLARQKQENLQGLLNRAEQAKTICQTNEESFQKWSAAQEALKTLEKQRKQRDKLRREQEEPQQQLTARQTALARQQYELEELVRSQTEIEKLQPLIAQQTELEQQQTKLREELQEIGNLRRQVQTDEEKITKIRTILKKLEQEIEEIQGLADRIKQIPILKQQCDRFQIQLSRLKAAQQFETELRQLITRGQNQRSDYLLRAGSVLTELRNLEGRFPQLAYPVHLALEVIQSGVDLNTEILGALQQILQDLTQQTSEAEIWQKLEEAQTQLNAVQEDVNKFGRLADLQEKQAELEEEEQILKAALKPRQLRIGTEPDLKQRWNKLTDDLNELDNPKGRSQLLQRKLQTRPQVQAEVDRLHKAQKQLQGEIDRINDQLTAFADLEEKIETQKQIQESHQAAQLLYVKNLNEADFLHRLKTQMQEVLETLRTLQEEQEQQKQTYEILASEYDSARLDQLETSYLQTVSEQARLSGGLPGKQRELARLETELQERQNIDDQRQQLEKELAHQRQTLQFIEIARDVYNRAGPRITRYYLDEISREADRLFRELLNRQTVALEWTGDYEIRVQENGYWRGFKNLSGGEQMCAALAVRLALLRVLADVDVAFFDEPTTNMDRLRRQQLAEAIANLKTFRQLFIISHDDTFETITENIIRVERDG
ncbi:MAG: SMC family ATPase [Leptolyngbyaceae cyanobacterium bins.59]|nr:SMC family ATPase [Leptolyngbyaceae cyanobacterium bins.59]